MMTQCSARAPVVLQLGSSPVGGTKISSTLKTSSLLTWSINCFFFARKSSLKWLFVGKYSTVVPRYLWYCCTTIVPSPRRYWYREVPRFHGSTMVLPNTSRDIWHKQILDEGCGACLYPDHGQRTKLTKVNLVSTRTCLDCFWRHQH